MKKRILITGAESFVGTSVERWLDQSFDGEEKLFSVDTADTRDSSGCSGAPYWGNVDFSRYDAVFHVAGIAHVNPRPEMASLYYRVNRDLALRVARRAKEQGVRQFIYMSSRIVYHSSRSLQPSITTRDTQPRPNDFYGDSKLQAELGLKQLEGPTFKVVILRPPMIYGHGNKGNLQRLAWLATRTPVFPAWHNKRSVLHVNNLAEFVRQVILRDMAGTFFPQDAEYADTVEMVRYFARKYGRKIWITRALNPLVWLGSFFLAAVPKMFADSCYEQEMSNYPFNYQVIRLEEGLQDIEPKNSMQ